MAVCRPTRQHGVQVNAGVLHDDPDSPPAQCAQLLTIEIEHVLAGNRNRPVGDAPRIRNQVHQRPYEKRFANAALPDHPQGFSPPDFQGHVIQSPDGPGIRRELHGEVPHRHLGVQAARHAPRSLLPSIRAIPSPNKAKPNTDIDKATPGENGWPPLARHDTGGAGRDHQSPFGRRNAHAGANEAESRREQHGDAHGDGRLVDDDSDHVRNEMPPNDPVRRHAQDDRRLNEGPFAQRQQLGPDQPDKERHIDKGNDDNDDPDLLAGNRYQHHGENEDRKGLDQVGDAHDQFRPPGTEIACNAADRGADGQGKDRRGQRDPEVDRGAEMTRQKTSMPTSSVPNQCAPLGGSNCCPGLASIGG